METHIKYKEGSTEDVPTAIDPTIDRVVVERRNTKRNTSNGVIMINNIT